MARRKVAILGAAGFIGTNLYDTIAREVPRTFDRNPAQHVQHVMDLSTERPDFTGCRAVVCCASTAHVWGKPIEDIRHEEKLVARMLTYAEEDGVDLFVHLSSSAVYGDYKPYYSEYDDLAPISKYGKQKVLAERAVRDWQIMSFGRAKMKAVSIRVFNAVGKYQRRTMFPYIVVENALLGKVTPLYTAEHRSWTPVTDVCKFIMHIVDSTSMAPGTFTVVNCGNPKPVPNSDVLNELSYLLKRRRLPQPKTERVHYRRNGEAGGYFCDMSKTLAWLIGLPPMGENLSKALDDVIDTVLDNMRVEFQTPRLVARHDPLRAY